MAADIWRLMLECSMAQFGEASGILQRHGLTPGHFKQEGRDRAKGARRPLRVKPTDTQLAAGVDEHGPHVTVAFTLPAGSYATVLLRESSEMSESST